MARNDEINRFPIKNTTFKSIILAGSALLIGIYVLLSLIMFPTPFIGGSGTLNLGLIGTPITGILTATWLMNYCHSEKEGFLIAVMIGGFGGLVASFTSPANFCGLWFIMLPLMGVIGTFLTFRGGKYAIVPLVWVLIIAIGMFTTFQLVLINIPHLIALIAGILAIVKVPNYIKQEKIQLGIRILLACVVGTVAEWCALNIFAAWILEIPLPAWYGIMPLVFIERGFSVVGGFIIVYSVLLALQHQKIIEITKIP